MRKLAFAAAALFLSLPMFAQETANFSLPVQEHYPRRFLNNERTTGGFWLQGMYNKTKYTDIFDADIYGGAVGIEGRPGAAFRIGAGYAYTVADSKDYFADKTKANANTFLLYMSIKPGVWFLDLEGSYTMSSYKYTEQYIPNDPGEKWDVNIFRGQGLTGFDIRVGNFFLVPQAGVRYLYAKKDETTWNGIVLYDKANVSTYTGIAGLKLGADFYGESVIFRPEIGGAFTRDFKLVEDAVFLAMPNGSVFVMDGPARERNAFAPYASLMFSFGKNVDLIFSYEGDFRKDFKSHTGLATLRFNFGAAAATSDDDSRYNTYERSAQPVRTVSTQQPPAYVTPEVVAAPVIEITEEVHVGSLYFNTGIAELGPNARTYLTQKAAELKNVGYNEVAVYGYTDNKEANPLTLSKSRATAVAGQLVSKGVDGSRVKIYSMGAKSPAADNATEAGRKINRRVEVQVK